MRKALVSGWTDEFRPVIDFTQPAMERFAREQSYLVHIGRLGFCGRVPSWCKIPLLLALLNGGYERVVWVDADALLVRFDEDVPCESPIGMVEHRVGGKAQGPNAGVMVLTPEAVPFLEDVWQLTEYLEHPWWEQAAMLDLFAEGKYGWSRLPLEWNSIPGIDMAESPRIVHAAGGSGLAPWQKVLVLEHYV